MSRYWQFIALAGLLTPIAAASQIVADEMAIQGTWLLVATEADGKQDTTNKNVNKVFLVFGANGRYAVKPPGFEFPGTYKLDASRMPNTLDVTVGSRTLLALYELTGDTLRICEGSGTERPRNFSSSECSRNGVIGVYRRVP